MYKLAGDHLKLGDHSTALSHLDKMLNLAEVKKYEHLKSSIYLKYSDIYEEMGNGELKDKYYMDYQNARNPYEKELDEKIRQLNKENEKYYKYLIFTISLLAFLISYFFYRRYRSKKKANQKLSEQKLQLQKWNAELEWKNQTITAQKQEIEKQVEEKDILMRELHHRVKNNLQMVYSMLNIQSRQLKDPDSVAALQSSTHRIWAMALIHHKLYLDEKLTRIKMKDYIHALIASIQESHHGITKEIQIITEVEDLYLEADIAIPLGLVINELTMNAIKHAFVSISDPALEISLRSSEHDRLFLMVKDNGIGLPENYKTAEKKSFGLELVSLLTRQLHGQLEIHNQQGTCITLMINQTKTH